MLTASYLKSMYLMWLAQPACDRSLFRRIRECKPQRIVEIGIGDGVRSCSAIVLAQRYTRSPVSYCVIDLFEASPKESPLTLKQAHHRLSRTGAKIRLIPGDPFPALARNANFLTGTDLLIIDNETDDIAKAREYVPRMLHSKSAVATYLTSGGVRRIVWQEADFCSEAAKKAA